MKTQLTKERKLILTRVSRCKKDLQYNSPAPQGNDVAYSTPVTGSEHEWDLALTKGGGGGGGGEVVGVWVAALACTPYVEACTLFLKCIQF